VTTPDSAEPRRWLESSRGKDGSSWFELEGLDWLGERPSIEEFEDDGSGRNWANISDPDEDEAYRTFATRAEAEQDAIASSVRFCRELIAEAEEQLATLAALAEGGKDG